MDISNKKPADWDDDKDSDKPTNSSYVQHHSGQVQINIAGEDALYQEDC